VRQALAYGIDMDQVIKAVVFGEATKQVAHHVPVQWAYPSGIQLNQYTYDKAKAQQLLKDAAGPRARTASSEQGRQEVQPHDLDELGQHGA